MTNLLEGAPASVTCLCLYCQSPLEDKHGKQPKEGDLIECAHCGNLNDFSSVVAEAKERAEAQVKLTIEQNLNNLTAKLFKK